MFEHQIRGMTAISIILAFIPLVIFLTPLLFNPSIPVLSTSVSDSKNMVIVEVIQENGESGIFFVEPGTTATQLFSQTNIKSNNKMDLNLHSGIKIHLVPAPADRGIVIGQMDAEKRLALGLPLDINLASLNDLRLVPGIGDGLAIRILNWRQNNIRFEKIEQLMNVNGIKEKKLLELRKYLYVDEVMDQEL